MVDVTCPSCGTDLSVSVSAALPAETDLTLALDVAPGQLMRVDTLAGILASFRNLQIAVGESMGATTEVFLASVAMEGSKFSFTTRIVNAPRPPALDGGSDG